MAGNPIPVFPLNTPLLPGCRLPLQIFEKRYLDMIAHCMKEDQGFVVTLLKSGAESHEVNRSDRKPETTPFYDTGTLARIVDFGQRDNGLLAITIEGKQREALADIHQQADGLWLAQSTALPEQGTPGEEELAELQNLLGQLLDVNGVNEQPSENFSSEQVMNYLIMLLPIPTPVKQQLLESSELSSRWQGLRQAIAELIRNYNEQPDH